MIFFTKIEPTAQESGLNILLNSYGFVKPKNYIRAIINRL